MKSEELTLAAKRPSELPAIISAPASKSISHRMLIAAALSGPGPLKTTLQNVLDSEDTKATIDILSACGAQFDRFGDDISIKGLAGQIQSDSEIPLSCDVSESGTTCRLLTAVLAAGHGFFRLHGAPRMQQRPMLGLISTLEKLGTKFTFEEKPGHLPFVMESRGFSSLAADAEIAAEEQGISARGLPCVEIDTSETSQYLSGLLLGAPILGFNSNTIAVDGVVGVASGLDAAQGLQIIPVAANSGKIVSWPYALLTLQVLADFGIHFKVEQRSSLQASWQEVPWQGVKEAESGLLRITVNKGMFKSGNYIVEGDFSNASYFLAAGVVGKRPVSLKNLRANSLQGDMAIIDILQRMGAKINFGSDFVTAMPSREALRGIDVDMTHCPDLVPTVAAVAAFAKGPTTIRGVAHLRIKESDRISAPATELLKLGCETKELSDGLVINPPAELVAPTGAFSTYNDHRMAMSMALFSCAGFDVRIENPDCVAKSFPGFWDLWKRI